MNTKNRTHQVGTVNYEPFMGESLVEDDTGDVTDSLTKVTLSFYSSEDSFEDDDGIKILPMLIEEEDEPYLPEGGEDSGLPVEFPLPRAYPSSRPFDPKSVLCLIRSILTFGVLNGVITDKNYRIIVGAHRWAACLLIRTSPSERRQVWVQIFGAEPSPAILSLVEGFLHAPNLYLPYIYTDFDSVVEPSKAFEVEVIDNRQRKGYSSEEVRRIIARLQEMGYTRRKKKPRKGEMPISNGLEMFGISAAMARRAENKNIVNPSKNGFTPPWIKSGVTSITKFLNGLKGEHEEEAQALSELLRDFFEKVEASVL